MTTYNWPTAGKAFTPKTSELGPRPNQRASISSLSGAVQTTSLPGARWFARLGFPEHSYLERSALEGLLNRLSGMEHRLSLWDHRRPVPNGTCNLTGVTASAAAQFATSIVLNGCGNTRTLLAGDWFRVVIGSLFQLVQVSADATSSAGGVMTVEFRQMLRGAVAGGSAVVLDKPTALFILRDDDLVVPYGPSNLCPEFSVQLLEVFA